MKIQYGDKTISAAFDGFSSLSQLDDDDFVRFDEMALSATDPNGNTVRVELNQEECRAVLLDILEGLQGEIRRDTK